MKSRNFAALVFVLLMFCALPVTVGAEALDASIPKTTEMMETLETPQPPTAPNDDADLHIQGTVVVASEKSEREGLDAATITAIASAVTAVAAIVTPNVSSVMKARSEERKARFEQYSPQVYAAVSEFTAAYSRFHRLHDYTDATPDYQSVLDEEVSDIYKNFSAASYKLISLIPHHTIRNRIINLLSATENVKYVSALEDSLFQAITADLANVLSP